MAPFPPGRALPQKPWGHESELPPSLLVSTVLGSVVLLLRLSRYGKHDVLFCTVLHCTVQSILSPCSEIVSTSMFLFWTCHPFWRPQKTLLLICNLHTLPLRPCFTAGAHLAGRSTSFLRRWSAAWPPTP